MSLEQRKPKEVVTTVSFPSITFAATVTLSLVSVKTIYDTTFLAAFHSALKYVYFLLVFFVAFGKQSLS